jgi:hypothetical protein
MSGKSGYRISKSKKSWTGKKKLPIEQKAVVLKWKSIWLKERMQNRKVKCRLNERRERIDCKAVRPQTKESVLKKGSANHDVWKLMNAGEIQMEGWLKLVRKERNYQSVQVCTAEWALNLIERKNQAEQAAWIPDQRWRDLMEWLGDFNRKLDGSKF